LFIHITLETAHDEMQCDETISHMVTARDVQAEAGSGPFSAEARKFYRFRFHIGYLT